MRNFFVMSKLCCWGLAALLATPSVNAATAPRPIVKVGYYEIPPHSYTDKNGRAQGRIIELTQRVLEQAGYQAQIRAYPSARLYNGLRNGSVQLWPGAAGKVELAEHTLESRNTLGEISLNLYYRPDTLTPRFPDSLRHRSLIMLNGYTYSGRIHELLADPNMAIEQHRTTTHAAALEMLLRYRGDFLLDYHIPHQQASKILGVPELPFIQLERIPVRFIFSKHDANAERLRNAMDRAYEQLRAQGVDVRVP
ncbi:substrate-binding periplasmic protein [Pseudomonas sp. 5P_3.1_Bac2]|uniref:substrate-binding periplasmic protein n=1 Tax=Pseudomonas sp. 5P_3.1_Bac2 TaxID=2971617 RepID=UPI0021C6A26D|nr:transporter substrate-binding domain-containing protein [Pseudomonas sp. 5P_3.1_Bac2]MCU1717647.1 transporter substrate-binding domain-containing protein [Pseudomonas sp. 5P_3.1_Bac2]